MPLVRQPIRVLRLFTLLTTLTVPALGCDATSPALALRAEVSPAAILAGGSDTTTIRVTVVNLTAFPVERVLHCDNLFAVDNALGVVVVSSYRVTCPAENSIPFRLQLDPFESVEVMQLWTGVSVRYADGGYVTVALPPGRYRVYGVLDGVRSRPRAVELVAP